MDSHRRASAEGSKVMPPTTLERLLALAEAVRGLLQSYSKEELDEAIKQAKSSGGDTSAIEQLLNK